MEYINQLTRHPYTYLSFFLYPIIYLRLRLVLQAGFGWFLFNEALTVSWWVGTSFIIIGITLLSREEDAEVTDKKQN